MPVIGKSKRIILLFWKKTGKVKMKYDYIIVGQGIAGSTLAYQLIKEGKKLVLFNKDNPNSSSMVAAGIYNPITGRKMVKTWKADVIFPYLEAFYPEMEQKLNTKFMYQLNVFRPFIDIEEQNDWMGKSATKDYADYVQNIYTNAHYSKYINDEFGGLELRKSGYLDIPHFLGSAQKYFQKHTTYYQGQLDEKKLQIQDDLVSYEGIEAERIIFCDGASAQNCTFFNWLPFRLVKGEILIVESELSMNKIFNRGVFVLPVDGNICKVGATYENKDLSLQATVKAKKQLTEKLDSLLKIKYRVHNQVAGIRPATRDRRPFIGLHPKHKNVGIFNGFGTKGVSLAPYFSKQFVNHLERGEVLDREVNINRYFSLN